MLNKNKTLQQICNRKLIMSFPLNNNLSGYQVKHELDSEWIPSQSFQTTSEAQNVLCEETYLLDKHVPIGMGALWFS